MADFLTAVVHFDAVDAPAGFNERRACDRTIRVKRWCSLVSLNIIGHMLRSTGLFVVLTATALAQDTATDESQVWQLENAYWKT